MDNTGPETRALWQARLQAAGARALPEEGRRRAAVALAVVEAGHGADAAGLPAHAQWQTAPALLLTRRAAHLRAHAGQWALPGGRLDAGETPEQAALRELHEEVGLALPADAVLGRLDDYATRSGYVITPVLVWAGAALDARANPDEVASLHRIPVAELLRPDAPLLNQTPHGEHPALRMPIGHSWIAAPTGAFLYQFAQWCLRGEATRVAHFDQPRFAWQ
ncbi:CoA pyrophosphatase [Ideonella sp. 4Y11]|uniref:CoA pyrophosphatase n=1 Tax=Ideonella aquatica TaxID=2824119 RepID=A0A940YIT3_9BURK|nr:CoA pyrophosphatase [Ideonella aquatica]MBQ0961038.1 CoA pyrophosphatase [Ideonella aquatica]